MEKLIMKIDKRSDPRLKKHGIKMKADGYDKSIKDPLPQPNFFTMFVGAPGSGKTTLAYRLFNDKNFKGGYYGVFDKIYLFSRSLSSIVSTINISEKRQFQDFDLVDINNALTEAREDFIQSIEDPQEDPQTEDEKPHQSLFVFDDCATLFEKDIKSFMNMVYNRRNMGISIFLITQKYNKIPMQIREALSSCFLFKPNTKNELITIYKDLIDNLSIEEFREMVRKSFDEKHVFLLIKKFNHKENEYYRNFNKIELKRLN